MVIAPSRCCSATSTFKQVRPPICLRGQSLRHSETKMLHLPRKQATRGGESKVPEEPKKVVDPKAGEIVGIPEGGSYYDCAGTLGRRYAGSKNPTGIPTYLWSTMSTSAKDKAIREEAAEVARRLIEEERGAEASNSSRKPAGVADNLQDHWERQGHQLVRHHYTPRKEIFSQDLTDCPVNSPTFFQWVASASPLTWMTGQSKEEEIASSVSIGSARRCLSSSQHQHVSDLTIWTRFHVCRRCRIHHSIGRRSLGISPLMR